MLTCWHGFAELVAEEAFGRTYLSDYCSSSSRKKVGSNEELACSSSPPTFSSFAKDCSNNFLYSTFDLAATSWALVLDFCWRNCAVIGSMAGWIGKEYFDNHSNTLNFVTLSGLKLCYHLTLNFLDRMLGIGGFWTKVYSELTI